MINQERLERALDYLGSTDEPTAEAKTDVERCGWICKRRRAFAYQTTSGTVDERKADVELNVQVTEAEESRLAAFLVFEKLKAKRETEALIVEVWRSLNANRRQGQ